MARFQLREKHYLHIDNCEYEYKEEQQTRVRGRQRQMRKVFPVPMYLDPTDPYDCNYGNPDRVIISTKEDPLFPDDYLVRGEFSPTFDMIPLDDEANEIMADFKSKYNGEHPIDALPVSYGEMLLEKMSRQLEQGLALNAAPVTGPISTAEVDKLKSENAALNAKLDLIMQQLGGLTAKGVESSRPGGL